MKKTLTIVALMLVASAAAFAQSKVYLTREISPESLVRIYKALGVPAKGRVAVKMSTEHIGESLGTHTIDHAAQIGLGSKKYELVNLK